MTEENYRICKKCLIENWDKIEIGGSIFLNSEGSICLLEDCPYRLERLMFVDDVSVDMKNHVGIVLEKTVNKHIIGSNGATIVEFTI